MGHYTADFTISGLKSLPEYPTAANSVHVHFDYSGLHIGSNGVTLRWTLSEDNACQNASFQLQGHTLGNIRNGSLSAPSFVIAGGGQGGRQLVFVIPREQLRINSTAILYRVVALFENGSICSHRQTDSMFYNFTG